MSLAPAFSGARTRALLPQDRSMNDEALSFLIHLHPYDALPEAALRELIGSTRWIDVPKGQPVYTLGERLEGLYIITGGRISVRDASGAEISQLQRENSFGERGLLRDGTAATSARALEDSRLICLPAALFHELRRKHEPFARFFDRNRPEPARQRFDLARVRVETLMVADPVTCAPDLALRDAARMMRDKRISCLCVLDAGRLVGIVTLRDLAGKGLAEGLAPDTPVRAIMTPDPRVLPPNAIGSDVLHLMMEHRLGHLPVVQAGKLLGIVTQTDLTRFQASNTAGFVAEAARAPGAAALAAVTARIPDLLVQLVASGNRHDVVTRMITDIADVVTRRLLHLAEEKYGPPPVRYVWLACGSQGRQEQTGVSDQDNCLILEDEADENALAYFEPFAHFVSDGLNACGYVFCPGNMMATNPRWRQPLATWREYFQWWIKSPSKEAQMLASVMFDLRPIGGDLALFEGLQAETLKAASANSIFTAHMAGNALTHATPLGLLRGLATIRSGENRNTVDMKLNGVVPVVDLGRMYALQGQLRQVNTRARLEAAIAAEIVSKSGGRDLLEAYDLVAQTRLEHQARRIRKGEAPDNFLPPAELSAFERSHLRDAFVVIKTMQSALMQGRGVLG
jgi:CBS domain-containing protein